MSKKYKAIVRTEVSMNKEEYKAYLTDRKDMYLRLIKDEDRKLKAAQKRWDKQVDQYQLTVDKITAELQGLK